MNVLIELVTITDGHLNVQYINPGVERLLGFTTEDLIGKNMIEMYRCENTTNRFDLNEASQHVLRKSGNREWEGTCYVRRKTGDSVPLYSRLIAVYSQKE